MNQSRSSKSTVRRYLRPLVGVGTVLIVSASAVAVAGADDAAKPDVATSVASSAPATMETSVVASSVAPATEAPAVASSEAPVVESSAVVATAVESSTVESTPAVASAQGHPLVGAWVLTDETDPEGPSSILSAFSSDGIYTQAETDGTVGIGAWEATGANTANLTFMEQFPDDEGGGSLTVRASIEVAPDGQTLTADFTIQFTGEGAPEGEFGPGTVTGTRVSVEPMGTPAGSLEDLEGSFAEGTEVTAGTEMAAPPTTG
jgi:hypothetical protein